MVWQEQKQVCLETGACKRAKVNMPDTCWQKVLFVDAWIDNYLGECSAENCWKIKDERISERCVEKQ